MLRTKSQKFTGIAASMAVSLVVFANVSVTHASDITSEKMVELTNRSRVEAGLKPLTISSKLTLAAEKKANDMFAKQYFEHTSPDGVTPWYWFNSVGYSYTYAAENLAIDFTTAEGAHSALMKSTGHRENILGANYKEIGIAAVAGKFNGKNSIIIVEEFGATRDQNQSRDPFFETSVRQEDVKSVTAEVTQEKAPTNCNCEQGNNYQPSCNCSQKCNSKSGCGNDKSKDYGRIVPQIYSVRDMKTLKKVYTEDIFWKNAEKENDFGHSLTSSKAQLKSLLKSWTKGHCCAVISR